MHPQKIAFKISKYVPLVRISAICFFAMLGITLIVRLLSKKIDILATPSVISGIATIVIFLIMTFMGLFFYVELWLLCRKTYKQLLHSGKEVSAKVTSSRIVLSTPSRARLPNILELEVEGEDSKKLHFIDYTWKQTYGPLLKYHNILPKVGDKVIILFDPNNTELVAFKRPLKAS